MMIVLCGLNRQGLLSQRLQPGFRTPWCMGLDKRHNRHGDAMPPGNPRLMLPGKRWFSQPGRTFHRVLGADGAGDALDGSGRTSFAQEGQALEVTMRKPMPVPECRFRPGRHLPAVFRGMPTMPRKLPNARLELIGFARPSRVGYRRLAMASVSIGAKTGFRRGFHTGFGRACPRTDIVADADLLGPAETRRESAFTEFKDRPINSAAAKTLTGNENGTS